MPDLSRLFPIIRLMVRGLAQSENSYQASRFQSWIILIDRSGRVWITHW